MRSYVPVQRSVYDKAACGLRSTPEPQSLSGDEIADTQASVCLQKRLAPSLGRSYVSHGRAFAVANRALRADVYRAPTGSRPCGIQSLPQDIMCSSPGALLTGLV